MRTLTVGAVLLALVGGLLLGREVLAPRGPEPTPLHVAVPVENAYRPRGPDNSFFDLNPEATRLAYLATDPADTAEEPVTSTYLRDLDQPEAVRLAGTENARWLSFDPTGRWIAFAWKPPDGGRWELRRIAVDGRAPQTIFQDPRRYILGNAPTWVGPDRLAVIGDDGMSVHLVDAGGGMPRLLLNLQETIPNAIVVVDLKGSCDGSLLNMTATIQTDSGSPGCLCTRSIPRPDRPGRSSRGAS